MLMKNKFHGVTMKIEDEMEIRQISIYCDVFKTILKEHYVLSITKACVFAFLLWQENINGIRIFKSSRTRNIVPTYLSLLVGEYEAFLKSYEYMLKALHILIVNSQIEYANGMLKLLEVNCQSYCKEGEFIKKVIEESKKWSDQNFMREVLYNV